MRLRVAITLVASAFLGSSIAAQEGQPIVSQSVSSAIGEFAQICYGSYPSFEGFDKKAKPLGYRFVAPLKAYVNSNNGASVKVMNGSAAKVCSFSFVTTDSKRTFKKQMKTPFNATLRDLQGMGRVYVSQVEEGGLMIASTGTKLGKATHYELLLQVAK